jgi:hypothetical protein
MGVARFIWGLTGIAWAAASLLAMAGAQYWEATSLTDFLAVWLYTAAWLLAAPTMLLMTRGSPGRATNILAKIFAVAAIVVGTANALEDAVGLTELSTVYIVSFVVALLTLVPLTATLWRAGSGRLAGVTAALFVGSAFVTTGGGMLVFAALVALVVAPVWFGVRLGGNRLVADLANA